MGWTQWKKIAGNITYAMENDGVKCEINLQILQGLWFNPGDPSNAAEKPKVTILLISHAL